MADNDNEKLEFYSLPGTVNVSQAALDYARRFAEGLNSLGENGHWIVAFDWSTGREIKERNAPAEDLGPGFVLSAFRRKDMPVASLWTADGFQFAVVIPPFVLEASRQQLIDFDTADPFKLVLR